MNFEEFKNEIYNNSVVDNNTSCLITPIDENGRRKSDGKMVLTEVIKLYGIPVPNYERKYQLIDKILNMERNRQLFTGNQNVRRNVMNYADFKNQITNNSIVENTSFLAGPVDEKGRRSDGKWILTEVARLYGISLNERTKSELIQDILTEEMKQKKFTGDQITSNPHNKDFEIECKTENEFQPYTIQIHVRSKEKHQKLVRDLKRAREELCEDTDWILDPLFNALGIKNNV